MSDITSGLNKQCNKCKLTLPLASFYKHKTGKFGVSHLCKECHKIAEKKRYHDQYRNCEDYKKGRKAYAHEYHRLNRKRENLRVSMDHRKERALCIQYYGGKCACCGESRFEFLAIDHVNGGGCKHRGQVGGKVSRWCVKNNFPLGFRVLCHNCNMSLGLYGYCPHTEPAKQVMVPVILLAPKNTNFGTTTLVI